MGFLDPAGKLAAFFKSSQQYVYKKGEIILRPEDTPSGLYYVEKGFIKGYSVIQDGSENIYIIFHEGDIFPAHWEFVQEGENKIFYEAMTPVVLYRKPRELFEELISTDIEAAVEATKMHRKVIDMLAQRIENLEHTSSYARVVLRLLGMVQGFGQKDGEKIILSIPITHYDFAHTINMSRETASRELEKLKENGLIDEKNHYIVINNPEKLKNELDEFYLYK